MFRYHMKSVWEISAPLEKVYESIADSSAWSRWWPDVDQSYLVSANENDGIGSVWHYVWKTYYFWKLSFDIKLIEIEPLKRVSGIASGDLEGFGTWEFINKGQNTVVTYDWDVSIARPWMKILSPLLHSLFIKNHEVIMQRGGEGLSKWIGATLIESKTCNLNR